jgi:C4-dicarboxylate-specific signal transduction histidine kinase
LDPKAAKTMADRIQVQQVLFNLIRNAVEVMEWMRRRELAATGPDRTARYPIRKMAARRG